METRIDVSQFQVGHLERLPLGTIYPAIVSHVGRLLGKLPAGTELVIDYTGVGRPIYDMFIYSGISPVGVMITAGTAETQEGQIFGVPKLILVSRLQALLHEGRLKIQRELPEADALVRELQDFRVEFTAAGNLTFNARQGRHDDLVLALAIAAWRAHGAVGRGAGMFEYYRREAAKLSGGAETPRMVVGVGYWPLRPSDSVRYSSAVSVSTPDALPVVPTSNMRVSVAWQDQLAAEYLSPDPE
jgi:hypothetical protein